MEKEEIIVYHGTTKENAESIMNMKKFIPGNDNDNRDLLGKGIYFFTDYNHAILWNIILYNKHNRNALDYDMYNNKYQILDAIISVRRENMIDLNNLNDITKFDKIVLKINNILEKLPEYIESKNKNSAIINYLQKNGYIDDVYVVKQSIKQKLKVSSKHSVNYVYREVICVKDNRVIELIDLHQKISQEEFNDALYLSFINKNI